MKFIKLLLVVFVSFVSINFSYAQVIGDEAPDQASSGCTELSYNLTYKKSKDANTNGEVSDLQYFLQDQGFLKTDPNGIFGPATLRAVQAFQKKSKLLSSGYVGAMTRAKIKEVSCNTEEVTSSNVSVSSTTIFTQSASSNVFSCGNEYRVCANGQPVPRDADCTWRTDKCSVTTTKYIEPQVIPRGLKLVLSYDSNKKESSLVANMQVGVRAGSQDLYISKPGHTTSTGSPSYSFFGSLVNNINYYGEGTMSPVYSDNIIHEDSYYIVKAGKMAYFNFTQKYDPKRMFAGKYYVSFNYYKDGIYVGEFAKTNSVTVIGEKANTETQSTSYVNLTVSNYRVDYGGQTTLTWESSNVKSCKFVEGDNQFTNYENTVSGKNRYTQSLYKSQVYTIECLDNNDSVIQKSVGVIVVNSNGETISSDTQTNTLKVYFNGNTQAQFATGGLTREKALSECERVRTSNTGATSAKCTWGDEVIYQTTSITTNGPKYNAMSCSNPLKTGLSSGEVACYGIWDYGNEFGNDPDMCPKYGYSSSQTGCKVTTSACSSGTAIATKIFNPTSMDVNSSDIATFATNLKSTKEAVKKQIPTLWVYTCEGAQVTAPTTNFARTAVFVSQNISPNTTNVKIGSFTIQNTSNEDIFLSTSTINLSFEGSFGFSSLSNLSVRVGGTSFGIPVGNVSSVNYFSLNSVTVAPNTIKTFDIYADIGNVTSGSVTANMSVYYYGVQSMVSDNKTATGVSMTSTATVTETTPLSVKWGPQSNTPFNAGTSATSYSFGGSCYSWTTVECGNSNIQTTRGTCTSGSRYSTDFRNVSCSTAENTIVNAILAEPVLVYSSPVSQYVVGGTDFGIATFKLKTQEGSATIKRLKFNIVGQDTIASVTVSGVTAPVVNDSADVTGLSISVTTTGVDVPVTVKFNGFRNSTVGGYLTQGVGSVSLTLNTMEASSGSVVTKQTSASSNSMTLVASKPTITLSQGSGSLTNGLQKIGEFTVSAHANGPIALSKVSLVVSTSTLGTLNVTNVKLSDDHGATAISGSNVIAYINSGVDFDISFSSGNAYQISAGQSKTFQVWANVSGNFGIIGTSRLATMMSSSLSRFKWIDLVGGNTEYTGVGIYNFPTNSFILKNDTNILNTGAISIKDANELGTYIFTPKSGDGDMSISNLTAADSLIRCRQSIVSLDRCVWKDNEFYSAKLSSFTTANYIVYASGTLKQTVVNTSKPFAEFMCYLDKNINFKNQDVICKWGDQVINPSAATIVYVALRGSNTITVSQNLGKTNISSIEFGNGFNNVNVINQNNSSCVNITYNLHRGHESNNVTKLQKFLQGKGVLNEVTGFYGDKTIEGVKDYQANVGLPVTGMVYEATRESIRQESCKNYLD